MADERIKQTKTRGQTAFRMNKGGTSASRLPFRRRCIQLAAALIYNANLKGFGNGSIYQGKLKGMCVPGLNCYSCPGALWACPLGTLQNALSSVTYRIPMYIFGLLVLFGLLFGRLICGFLCPFGLLQELLYLLPLPKLGKSRATRALSFLKYLILAVFVVLLPLLLGLWQGLPVPAFCKYICPAGTLEGGLPLTWKNESLRALCGALFQWKVFLLLLFLISMTMVYRSFCRFVCPLGAIYSLFAKISLFGIRLNEENCTHCQKCVRVCKMDIRLPGDRECIHCGDCIPVCNHGAIRMITLVNVTEGGVAKHKKMIDA